MKAPIVAALAAALVLIAGCGGGGGAAGPEPGSVDTAQAYVPLDTGNWWLYEYRAPTLAPAQGVRIPDRSTRRVVRSRVIANKQWFEVELTDWCVADGIEDPTFQTIVFLRETTEGVYYYHDVTKQALPWVKKSAATGETWQPEKALGITWEMGSKSASADTPAGQFTGCTMVIERDVFGTGSEQTTEVWERWFKRGVGMVMDRYWGEPLDAQDYPGLDPWDETALLDYEIQ